jgi:hypothetical protein
MIAEEVSKAVAPLYEQLEQIKSKRSESETETFEKGYYKNIYEKSGRIKKRD